MSSQHKPPLVGRGCCARLEAVLAELNASKFLLVKDASFGLLPSAAQISGCRIPHAEFDGFTSNPRYEEVCQGVAHFRESGCDALVAVGGGSSLDVAKCIKLFARMEDDRSYLEQPFADSGIPLVAIPTTAGTGSEATRFAVLYAQGEKQSIRHDSILPSRVLLDADLLDTLPLFQRKCTLLDALCQGIEAWWSIHSTAESMAHSKRAVEAIVAHMDAYLQGDAAAAEAILLASNEAGQAINLTQTTAAHAMSYKLTSLYRLPHGYAVALCLPQVWRYMLARPTQCVDARGADYLAQCFASIAAALGCASAEAAVCWFEAMLQRLGMLPPEAVNPADLPVLATSINPIRLKNNPVAILPQDAEALYRAVLHG